MTPINPRYLAYCEAQGRTAAAQLAFDKGRFPGGCMCGFVLWIHGMWNTYWARNPHRWAYHPDMHDHRMFDRMLSEILGGH